MYAFLCDNPDMTSTASAAAMAQPPRAVFVLCFYRPLVQQRLTHVQCSPITIMSADSIWYAALRVTCTRTTLSISFTHCLHRQDAPSILNGMHTMLYQVV